MYNQNEKLNEIFRDTWPNLGWAKRMNKDMPWVNLTQEEVNEMRTKKHELTEYGKQRLREMSEKKVIWTSILDERYECKVARNSQYSGQLTVFDNQEKKYIYDEEVRLSYGATFGPDAIDVVEWQDKIVEIVDGN